MKGLKGTLVAAMLGVTSIASGQHHQGQPPPGGGPPPSMTQPAPQTQMHRQQEMAARMERMSAQVRELNQWMSQHQARAEFKGMGSGAEGVCDRLQTMTRTMDRLRQDKQIQSDPIRNREMDRIQNRFMVMAREMDEFQTGLRRASEGAPAPGDPPGSAEMQRMEQRRREVNARVEDAVRRSGELAGLMENKKVRQEYRDLCGEMGRTLEQLRLMERDMERLEKDGDFLRDRTKLRETDRMHDRLKAMLREMEEAQATLEGTVGR